MVLVVLRDSRTLILVLIRLLLILLGLLCFALGLRVGVASFSNVFKIFSQIANLWLDFVFFCIVSSCFDYAVLLLPNFECFKRGGKTECVCVFSLVKS